MPLIVPANEQGAGFMAAGYARASGKVGVCLVTSGPGATNYGYAGARLHGRLDADGRDLRPGSDTPRSAPTHSRKRRSRVVMGAVAKHVFLVTDPTRLEATMRTAFEIARTGRPGPVVRRCAEGRAELERRVSRRRAACRSRATGSGMTPVHNSAVGRRSAPRFFSDAWRESKRPLIYAGGGVINGDASDTRCARFCRRVRAFPW